MWEKVGPIRDEAGLQAALAAVDELVSSTADIRTAPERRHNLEALDALELDFMLTTARLIIASALLRRESRGAHTRLDYPDRDDERWLCNIVVSQRRGQLSATTREVRR
jgi:succinate dehydrogenase/fumarate reductase flavoprotein subunit